MSTESEFCRRRRRRSSLHDQSFWLLNQTNFDERYSTRAEKCKIPNVTNVFAFLSHRQSKNYESHQLCNRHRFIIIIKNYGVNYDIFLGFLGLSITLFIMETSEKTINHLTDETNVLNAVFVNDQRLANTEYLANPLVDGGFRRRLSSHDRRCRRGSISYELSVSGYGCRKQVWDRARLRETAADAPDSSC